MATFKADGWFSSREWLRLWRERTRTLAGPLVGLAIFVALALAFVGSPFGKAQTLGAIWVDSPEIYTRERLVNDRFIQDAWLNRQLTDRRNIHDALQVTREQRTAVVRDAVLAAAAAASGPRAEAVIAAASAAATAAVASPSLSSREELLAELDYRDLVRSMAIENQLDDRHDLQGRSLYRFKFDASIAPDNNTQAKAMIEMKLRAAPSIPEPSKPPERKGGVIPLIKEKREKLTMWLDEIIWGKAKDPPQPPEVPEGLSIISSDLKQIELWRKVYGRWIESLRFRLNQTQKELRQTYEDNEFSHNDYARFIQFVARNSQGNASTGACQADFGVVRDQDPDVEPLRQKEHMSRRACIGQFARASRGELSIANTADAWLRIYVARKAMQLVLGTHGIADWILKQDLTGDLAVKRLNELISLTLSDESELLVNPRELKVYAIDPEVIDLKDSDPKVVDPRLIDKHNELQDKRLEEKFKDEKGFQEIWAYFPPDAEERVQVSDEKDPEMRRVLRVSTRTREELAAENYNWRQQKFDQLSDGRYKMTVEVGLRNFAIEAGKNPRAFSYAMTPKESGVAVASSLGSKSRVDAGSLLSGLKGPSIEMARERDSQSVARRGTVVGFGLPEADGAARFGWVIGPNLPVSDGQKDVDVQNLAQYSLSALVSIPSWWNEVTLEVTTSWVNPDGSANRRPSQTISYRVDIPTDFEPLELALLQVEQLGPELMEVRRDPILLTACKPGSIVIQGRRLWRSTRVTLGAQTADEISVLPDMKGIVATFRRVENQATMAEAATTRRGNQQRDFLRSVRVWTSQGAVSLPSPARIGIPEEDCPAAVNPTEAGGR